MRAARDRDRVHRHRVDRARFCVATGVAPSEYDHLTFADINAFIDVVNTTSQTT